MLTDEEEKLIQKAEYEFLLNFMKRPSKLQKTLNIINDIVALIICLGIIIAVILAIILIIWFCIFIIFSSASFGWHLFA